jgi:hypothetical protein
VSRSKHTDPRAIRAERRLGRPRDQRGTGDPSRRNRIGRILKELGIVGDFDEADRQQRRVRPRIIEPPPNPGFCNPARKDEILQLLEFVGPEAMYGLRRVEYVPALPFESNVLPPVGRLIVPGHILLYQQPLPPWRLSGMLSAFDAHQFQRAGAIIATQPDIELTVVDWPGDSLRDFMLLDVLLHEVGHHILQHNKGKRTIRTARTRDHETFARLFVERCRALWLSERSPK